MVKIISFNEALQIDRRNAKTNRSGDIQKPHLLLANGFSIACRSDIFVYKRLFEQADFSNSPEAAKTFSRLGTTDFEKVIRSLQDAAKVASVYRPMDEELVTKLLKDADLLKELLVQTIASSHPERPTDIQDKEYQACYKFLNYFASIYTVNYDLLLYWALMHGSDGNGGGFKDGFAKPEDDYDATYVSWQENGNVWYLHGALHLFDARTEIQKFTWSNTGIRLIEQTRTALNKNFFPLFVAEGTSQEKLERITHSAYLSKALRSFEERMNVISSSLFVFGHSFSENDEHILKCIEKGRISKLFIGLHGDTTTKSNKDIINRAERLKNRRDQDYPLEISFFDASTANVWGQTVNTLQTASNLL
jgi:hypothetical protein